jgi:hypothetical protein
LIGEIARTDESESLPAFDLIAAVNQNGIEVTENLGANVGLSQRAKIDWSADFHGNVTKTNFGNSHKGWRAPFFLFAGVSFGASDKKQGDQGKNKAKSERVSGHLAVECI